MAISRINRIFNECRRAHRAALMPYITAGYPTLDATRDVLPALARSGASIIEVGIPFSDPIADGPIIAAAMHAALEQGVTPHDVFAICRDVRDQVDAGLIAMVSVSIVERIGADRFVADAAASGIDGLIIPDLDVDDPNGAARLAERADAHALSLALLIAPTTSDQRIATIVQHCRGFVYILARAGITGEQADAPDVRERVEQVRRHTDLPVAVGFGISTAAHVAAVTGDQAGAADAAIVGSALMRRMGEADDPVDAASSFVRELATGLGG